MKHSDFLPSYGPNVSLSRYGSLTQFIVAILLVSVIPALALTHALVAHALGRDVGRAELWCLGVVVVLLVVSGYVMLLKYPINVIRLRRHLAALAGGGLPGDVKLWHDEDDLKAIESHMVDIVKRTEVRIETIQNQTDSLLAAERQRVMIESLGAACHHLGQPATVITAYLDMIQREGGTEETSEMIAECRQAAISIAHILHRLQSVAEYRTVPYVSRPNEEHDGNRIIDIRKRAPGASSDTSG